MRLALSSPCVGLFVPRLILLLSQTSASTDNRNPTLTLAKLHAAHYTTDAFVRQIYMMMAFSRRLSELITARDMPYVIITTFVQW